MPAVARPWPLARGARPLARRIVQRRHASAAPSPSCPALALAALATAFAHCRWRCARAQSSDSPFQPSLTDPRACAALQGTSDQPRRCATAAATSRLPSGAGETGFDSTGAIGKKKKTKKRSRASRVRCRHRRRRRPDRRSRSAATPARRRSPRARPTPTPTSRRTRRCGGRWCRCRMPSSRSACASALPAEAVDRGHARLRQQPDAHPERQGLGLHGGRARAASCDRTGRATSIGFDLRGSYSDYDSHVVAERAAGRLQGAIARIDVTRDTTINIESRVLPVDRLSGQPEPAGRTSPSCRSSRPTAPRSA